MSSTELKNEGNQLIRKGDFVGAIDKFSQAIKIDPNNHILYSNRSVSYTQLKKYSEAVRDADRAIALKPDWFKGYVRKCGAFVGEKKFELARKTIKEGLTKCPNNKNLEKELTRLDILDPPNEEEMYKKMIAKSVGAFFVAEDFWTKINNSPYSFAFKDDPLFKEKVREIQSDPSEIIKYMEDPHIKQAIRIVTGEMDKIERMELEKRKREEEVLERRREKVRQRKAEEKKKQEELAKAEAEKPENKKKAEGNAFYRKKQFKEAMQCYDEAIEINPNNMLFYLNKASCYLEMEQFETAIEMCKKAMEVGKENSADVLLIVKALGRWGNVLFRQKKYTEALKIYKDAQVEKRTKAVSQKITEVEKILKRIEDEAYWDEDKAKEAKELGTAEYKKNNFVGAIKHYREAIKRDPKSAVYPTNMGVCYMKLLEYKEAIRIFDTAIKIDPKYVKAYSFKGQCYYFMKDYPNAMKTYSEGLRENPENKILKGGSMKVVEAMQSGGEKKADQENLRRAAQNPQVIKVLNDPKMQKVLEDLRTDPGSAQRYFRDPEISKNLQILIKAGILRTQ